MSIAARALRVTGLPCCKQRLRIASARWSWNGCRAVREQCQSTHTSPEGGLQVAVAARELDQARIVLAVCFLLQPPGKCLVIAVLLLTALACALAPMNAHRYMGGLAMQRLQCCTNRDLEKGQICL